MNYFAYGSNLSVARLRARVASATVHGVYELRGHVLRFHKVGMDGTAKCDAYFTGEATDRVEGVVYVLDPAEIALLDAVEGLGRGYTKQHVEVIDPHGRTTRAFTYVATNIDATLRPFHWYRQHVTTGAQQHGLSDPYIAAIEQVTAIADKDTARARRELAIYDQPL